MIWKFALTIATVVVCAWMLGRSLERRDVRWSVMWAVSLAMNLILFTARLFTT